MRIFGFPGVVQRGFEFARFCAHLPFVLPVLRIFNLFDPSFCPPQWFCSTVFFIASHFLEKNSLFSNCAKYDDYFPFASVGVCVGRLPPFFPKFILGFYVVLDCNEMEVSTPPLGCLSWSQTSEGVGDL